MTVEKKLITRYIATYIQDENPNTGDWCGDPEAIVLCDEDGETLYGDTYSEMYSLCNDDAEFFMNNSPVAEERGYHIIESKNGMRIVDNEDYPICIYNIHELQIPVYEEVK
jgi:hypothetical protein